MELLTTHKSTAVLLGSEIVIDHGTKLKMAIDLIFVRVNELAVVPFAV